jgi:hypothetical protein
MGNKKCQIVGVALKTWVCCNFLFQLIHPMISQLFSMLMTLIIREGDTRQLFFLKSLLNSFSMSTGLKVNFNKSMMVPINVFDARLEILAGTFGCSKGSLPFTYLGLPLNISRPRVQDFLPIINRCEKRLTGLSSFLNQAGKLQMTNAVFSSLPTFFMCTLALQV